MSVIPLTVFFSLLLVTTFVVLFARERYRRPGGSAERDSLLPLAEEMPLLVGTPAAAVAGRTPRGAGPDHDHDDEHDHPHDHAAGGNCGCRTGLRSPCSGCLRRRDEPATPRT